MTVPARPTASPAAPAFSAACGELGAAIPAFDWSRTPLGPFSGWPGPMRLLLETLLRSPSPMATLWGPEGLMIYNDAFATMTGEGSSRLGLPAKDGWPEAAAAHDRLLRPGSRPEGASFSAPHAGPGRAGASELDGSAIPGEGETSQGSLWVLAALDREPGTGALHGTSLERRQAMLLALADRLRHTSNAAEIVSAAAEAVGREIGASRVGLGEIGAAHEEVSFATIWSDGEFESGPDDTGIEQRFSSRLDDLRSGRTTIFASEAGPSGIVVPLVREGRLRGFLLAADRRPRVWPPEDVALVEDVASRTWDALERAQAAALLQRNQTRQGFLLVLGDRLRELDDADDIMETVAESVGRHLRLSRAGYGEVGSGGEIVFATGWSDGSVAPLLGEFPLAALGSRIVEDLSFGLTTIFDLSAPDDADPDDADPAGASIMAGLSSGAAIPLIRDGRLRGALVLGRRERHEWSADETALAGEAAARLWEALERARAEAALHELNATLENRVAERTQELTSSEARFRTLFENAPAPIFLIRVGPGRQAVYDAVNAAAERFTGRPAQDIVGRAVTHMTSTGEPLLERCMQSALSGQPVEYEITLEVAGDWRIAECVLAPLPGDGDGRHLLIGIARDITRLRHAEEQLRQAQKMEAIGQLTGGIAHDFNNLLTGIIGSLALMEKRLAQGRTDAIQRYAGLALASANRAAALTHRLLAFSRRQPLESKSVNVNSLVISMDDLLRRTLGESIAFDTILSSDIWQTLCDPHQLENAILNLAINARDAMPDGGRLAIETSNVAFELSASALEQDIRPGQYVLVSVADTGSGMPPDVLARAFDPFYTTKPVGQGTGLGLSMIYGFAKQSDGHLELQSEVGRGTTVRIFLPRYKGMDAAATSAVAEAVPRAEAGQTVLVVEDDHTVRGLALEVLQDLGYITVEATDGPSGLRILQSDKRLDLLITDVGLPGMNGRQLAEQGRVHRPDLKILFITGYAENAAFGAGHLEAGIQMMTKPFTFDELAARIHSILGPD